MTKKLTVLLIMNEAIMNETNLFDYTWLHCNFFHYCFQILLPITCIHDWHFFFFINLFYLFIFGYFGSSLLYGRSLVAVSGGYSLMQCAGFSLRWLLLLQSTGSRRSGFSSCGSRALECRLNSCGARALLLCGMWDLPGPGLKPMSPTHVSWTGR